MLGCSVLAEKWLSKLKKTRQASMVYTAVGSGLAFIIVRVIQALAIEMDVALPLIGRHTGLLVGCFWGFIVSLASAGLFHHTRQPSPIPPWKSDGLDIKMFANVFPAAIEEAAFRGGVVHFLNILFGKGAALLGGSIPFGLVHLVGRLFGRQVNRAQVVGVSLAGLVLSLLYLHAGLLSAIGFHWTWNVACVHRVLIFSLPQENGVELIESHWTTLVTLAAFTLLRLVAPRLVLLLA